MSDWETAILECIDNLEGEARLFQIYESIDGFIEISPDLQKLTHRGKQPVYHHHIRNRIRRLCRCGDLIRTGVGIYSLTSNGLKRLEN